MEIDDWGAGGFGGSCELCLRSGTLNMEGRRQKLRGEPAKGVARHLCLHVAIGLPKSMEMYGAGAHFMQGLDVSILSSRAA